SEHLPVPADVQLPVAADEDEVRRRSEVRGMLVVDREVLAYAKDPLRSVARKSARVELVELVIGRHVGLQEALRPPGEAVCPDGNGLVRLHVDGVATQESHALGIETELLAQDTLRLRVRTTSLRADEQ